MSCDDKLGGRQIGPASRNFLEELLCKSDLSDLGFSGNCYTRRKNRFGSQHIRQRLDRALANEKWRMQLSLARLTHRPPADQTNQT